MKDLTTRAADNIRILAASMVEKAKSGHPGGAMGGADFVNILYSVLAGVQISFPQQKPISTWAIAGNVLSNPSGSNARSPSRYMCAGPSIARSTTPTMLASEISNPCPTHRITAYAHRRIPMVHGIRLCRTVTAIRAAAP